MVNIFPMKPIQRSTYQMVGQPKLISWPSWGDSMQHLNTLQQEAIRKILMVTWLLRSLKGSIPGNTRDKENRMISRVLCIRTWTGLFLLDKHRALFETHNAEDTTPETYHLERLGMGQHLSFCTISRDEHPHRIHVWYIYLHDWVIYGVNVGKYSSTMDPMGSIYQPFWCGLQWKLARGSTHSHEMEIPRRSSKCNND